MSVKTDAQRLEFRDYIRRAANDFNRQSQFRRAAFLRMLDLAKEPDVDSFCKKLISERVKDFFVDFPEFQDEAINIVYDMCEDQDQEVRIAGYGAVVSVSKADKSWLMRNADVLVQLLQSDDPREMAVVKRALQEHVDLDPCVTLQVLCEQCVFNPADVADNDDRLLRSTLSSLVLQFLVEKYRVCIIRVVKNWEVESILLKGMLGAIPQATASELHMIVVDILLNLPCLSNGPSQNGNTVLNALLDAIKVELEMKQPDINKLCCLLEETVNVVAPLSLAARSTSASLPVSRSQSTHSSAPAADGSYVFKFFTDHSLLDRVPDGAALKVVECLCAVCDSVSTSDEGEKSGPLQFLSLSPAISNLLEGILRTRGAHLTSRSLLVVLRTIEEQLNLTNGGYSAPPSLAAALEALMHTILSASDENRKGTQIGDANTAELIESHTSALPDDVRQAVELLRGLLKAVGNRARAQSGVTETAKASLYGSSIFLKRSLASALPGLGVPPTTRQELAVLRLPGGQGMIAGTETREDDKVDTLSRPKKKRRGEGSGAPASAGSSSSLLSRLGEATSTPTKFRLTRSSISEPAVGTGETVMRSDGSVDLLSRITDSGALPRGKEAPYITTNARGQHPPASAGVGLHGPLRDAISQLSIYGAAEKTLDELKLHNGTGRSSANEPVGASILGAGAEAGGEIRIRGAAERRKGSNNEARARAPSGGGLSLLARLEGGDRADQFDGRKRKQAKS